MMENDYSKMTSAQIKEQLNDVVVDESLEDTTEIDLPGDEDEGDSESDPETELQQLQAEHEELQLSQMSPQARSGYRKAQKVAAQQKVNEMIELFQNDVAEFNSKYRGFEDVIERFADDIRFGNLGVQLSDEEFATAPSPQESLFHKWLARHSKEFPSDTLGKIINRYHSGPKLRTRVRDRLKGYDQPEKKASDREIDELADSLFEER